MTVQQLIVPHPMYYTFGIDAAVSMDPVSLFALSQTFKKQPSSGVSATPQALATQQPLLAPKALKETIQSARDLCDSAKDLEMLRAALLAFEGCALKITATNAVFGAGNPRAKVMLVGEAPGADEDRQGLPFVGMSGQLLDKMFWTIGLKRDDLYISNVVPYRPPGNRPPTPQEISLYLPFIEKHIALIKPEILVCVGATSAKALLNKSDSMAKLRSQTLTYDNPYLESPIPTVVIFHPAYLLRSPGQKRQAWHDLLALQKRLI